MNSLKVLSWFNAVALGVICLILLGSLGWAILGEMGRGDFSANTDRRFGAAYEGRIPYAGADIETPGPHIVAYSVEGDGFDGRAEGTNVSLTNMATGESRQIAPLGHSVVNWELIRLSDNGVEQAIGYTAYVASPVQWKMGRMDLVVGTFPSLKQNVVARNIRYSDLPVLVGDQTIAMIIWQEEDSAEFASIDILSGRILDRKSIALPTLQANRLDGGTPPMAPRKPVVEGAPINTFH